MTIIELLAAILGGGALGAIIRDVIAARANRHVVNGEASDYYAKAAASVAGQYSALLLKHDVALAKIDAQTSQICLLLSKVDKLELALGRKLTDSE